MRKQKEERYIVTVIHDTNELIDIRHEKESSILPDKYNNTIIDIFPKWLTKRKVEKMNNDLFYSKSIIIYDR